MSIHHWIKRTGAATLSAVLLVGNIYGASLSTYTMAENTKLRVDASPNADIIDFIPKNTEVIAMERQDNFYKVEAGDYVGYIYKSQIDKDNLHTLPYIQTTYSSNVDQSAQKNTYKGEEVVVYAKRFLGGRYVYGGNSLTNGVDCSGFTQQIMKKFGVNIQRSSRMQYAYNGYKVSKNNILPGDLVFYGSNGRTVDHVAIYAGNGQIIHANSAKTGIKMSRLNYGKPIIGIKRVL